MTALVCRGINSAVDAPINGKLIFKGTARKRKTEKDSEIGKNSVA